MFSSRQRILINKLTSNIRFTRSHSTVNNGKKMDFVSAIHIPETELAYNAFFSLHRPLLGLSEQNKEGFFSVPTLSPEEALKEKIIDYMIQLEPFVPPSAIQKKTDVYYESDLRVFHMSATTDVLDYLTSVQHRLDAKYAMLEQEQQQTSTQEKNKNESKKAKPN